MLHVIMNQMFGLLARYEHRTTERNIAHYSKHVFATDLTRVVIFVQTFSSDEFRSLRYISNKAGVIVKGTGNSFRKSCICQRI